MAPLHLPAHIPLIADFWEAVLFGRHYGKNVMAVHQNIHQRSPIRKEHLQQWVRLFTQTVDEFFEGSHAMLMKQRAQSIATLMEIKLGNGK